MAWPVTDLGADEVSRLAATLAPFFGDGGTRLSIDAPAEWCLQLPNGLPVAKFVAPIDALGADLLECLPGGEAGRPWRRLFNEAQVVLHAHPVNATRTTADKLPVNAVWFWGAGALPAGVDTTLKAIATGDSVLLGLAKLARVDCAEASPATLAAMNNFGVVGDALLDLDAPGQPGAASSWLGDFRQWLGERRFGAIVLVFADGKRYRVRHAHRLRFWRHA